MSPVHVQLPLWIRASAVAGVAVPALMLTHLNHTEKEELAEAEAAARVEGEVLASQVGDLEGRNDVLTSKNAALEGERDMFAELLADVEANATMLRERLAATQAQLGAESSERTRLEVEVEDLSGRVATLLEREEGLRGIIDLLEKEVESAETRLAKLKDERNDPSIEALAAAAIVAARSDSLLRQENDRLRNEMRKHDDQVVELLGEIGVLNEELAIMRGEHERLLGQAEAMSREAEGQGEAINSAFAGLVEDSYE